MGYRPRFMRRKSHEAGCLKTKRRQRSIIGRHGQGSHVLWQGEASTGNRTKSLKIVIPHANWRERSNDWFFI
ncbi:hypothetical protein ACHWQZ_G001453 [Mnemiopsis leidyi]